MMLPCYHTGNVEPTEGTRHSVGLEHGKYTTILTPWMSEFTTWEHGSHDVCDGKGGLLKQLHLFGEVGFGVVNALKGFSTIQSCVGPF